MDIIYLCSLEFANFVIILLLRIGLISRSLCFTYQTSISSFYFLNAVNISSNFSISISTPKKGTAQVLNILTGNGIDWMF